MITKLLSEDLNVIGLKTPESAQGESGISFVQTAPQAETRSHQISKDQ